MEFRESESLNWIRANLGNVATKNIAVIIATAMAKSGGVVSGNAINDFGYGTKFGTQPGKVIMTLNIYLVIIMIGDWWYGVDDDYHGSWIMMQLS